MEIFKIPHKWWHLFFTKWEETRSSGYKETVCYSCSKCKTIYEIESKLKDYEVKKLKA